MSVALESAPVNDATLAAARDGVREALTAAPRYAELPPGERRTIANSLVRIAHAAGVLSAVSDAPAALPQRTRRPVRALNAGDEYSGVAVDRAAGATQAILKAVSFPRFVNELITGVFKAMLDANQQQINQYVELIRGVSQSLDGFETLAGSEGAARAWLVERFPASFALDVPERDEFDGPPQPGDDPPEPPRLRATGAPPTEAALRAAFGLEPDAEVPSGGAESLVPFAKRALAKSKQEMLATMVSMGMQRIVIDGGRISAAMRFHIDARSAAREDRGTSADARIEASASAGGSFGPFSASASLKSSIGFVSTRDVSTAEETNVSADLASSVELQFRTDQVPLDRLASQQTVERLKLNTLNPTRELELAAQTDQARASAQAAGAAARPTRTAVAPPITTGAPAAPPPLSLPTPPAGAPATQPTATSPVRPTSPATGTPATGTPATAVPVTATPPPPPAPQSALATPATAPPAPTVPATTAPASPPRPTAP
jgi:hypothetical protein